MDEGGWKGLFPYNPSMSNQPMKRTYFGITALGTGILSVLGLGANYAVAYMNITPAVFGQWNVITALFYCALTPLAFALGVAGLYFKKDSKPLSWVAIATVTIPFLVILVQFVLSLLRSN